jgi:Cytochrome c554 and c-prime
MKWILPAIALSLVGFGFTDPKAKVQSEDVIVVISGGARGHLSPCGCTKPMTGGFKRLATIVREMKSSGNVFWIDSGDIIGTPGRQSQLKVETYGELMGSLGVDAVAYTSNDQQQGVGLLTAGASLSKKKWLTPEVDPLTPTIAESIVGPLTVSATSKQFLRFGSESKSDILLFDGSSSDIKALSEPHELVVFASEGIPTVSGSKVSPGSNLRGVVVAVFRDRRFVSARVLSLEPSIKDDAVAEKVFRNYLTRVTQEKLIDSVLKDTNEDFAGSVNCKSCHGKIYQQFSKTKHAHAYNTLVKEGHQADPDCVSCHVVGPNSTKGFYFQKTKNLAQVGCESCHGAGRNHARNPRAVHLPKVTEKACLTCHTPSNSPTFLFKTYWKKIKH